MKLHTFKEGNYRHVLFKRERAVNGVLLFGVKTAGGKRVSEYSARVIRTLYE